MPRAPRTAAPDANARLRRLELDVMGELYSFACRWEQHVLAWPDVQPDELSARRQRIAGESARCIVRLLYKEPLC